MQWRLSLRIGCIHVGVLLLNEVRNALHVIADDRVVQLLVDVRAVREPVIQHRNRND